MLEWQKQAIFTQNVAKLLQFIDTSGYHVTLGEAYRTAEQAKIYAEQGKGIEDSLHCKRLAIDINLFTTDGQYLSTSEAYRAFGDYWKTLNSLNRWGGNFKRGDGNHFEMQDL